MRNLAFVIPVAMLAACSPMSDLHSKPEQKPDPRAASEQPVALVPGLYDVSIGGGTMVKLASGEYAGKVCFTPADAAAFPHSPLTHIFPEWPGCSSSDIESSGNAVKGKRTCESRLPAWINYSGSHTANSFIIVGSVAQGHDETSMALHLGSGDFTVAGKRIGAC